MIKRTFSLLSEEYTALIWTMNHIQDQTGSRPSTNKTVGQAITAFANANGYQAVNKEITNGTSEARKPA